MQNKDEENRTENKGVNFVTIVVCVFVVIFVAAGFASGGIVPAVMTVLVVMFVINSLKKQFRKVTSENAGDEDDDGDGNEDSDGDTGNVFEADVEAKADAKSKSQPSVVWNSKSKIPVRMNGESFDSFMLRRFGLTKATPSTTDAEREAKKADQAARADDLYDPDQYESVNEDLSEMDPDVLTVNGRKTRFKQKKNPFEM